MAATASELRAYAEANGINVQQLTDLDIFVEGVQVEALKDVGPSEAGPYLMAANLSAAVGMKVELRFSDIGVYEMANMAFADRTNISVTLRDA